MNEVTGYPEAFTYKEMKHLMIHIMLPNQTHYCTLSLRIKKYWFKAIKPLMNVRWTDDDLPLRLHVLPLRSPWFNVNVNGVSVTGWMGKGGGGAYIPGWRVVLKGLVASSKTLCSAPCLLNRAELIWVCLGSLLSSLGRLSPSLLLPLPSQPKRLTVSLKDAVAGHMLVDAHILQWKKCWPLSQRPVCQTTWWSAAPRVQRSPSSSVFLTLTPGSLCTRSLTVIFAVGCHVLRIQRPCYNPWWTIYTHYKGLIPKIVDVWVSVLMLWDRGSG